MKRQIAASALAPCPMSIAMNYAQSFLERAEAGGPDAIIVAGPLRRRVRVTFGLSTDATEPGRSHEELRIRWSARTPWLPDFSGTLQFRIASVDTTMLLLRGAYRPPGGSAGRAFDALVGRSIAQTTANAFVLRIARELKRRETDWQSRIDLTPNGLAGR